MGDKAIRVAGLGKEYQIGTRERGYTTFREAISRAVSAPFRRLSRLSGKAEEGSSFWALKDVSFEVEPGEVVGIIGRNGAGKSTLLKVLSQITEPTTGEITLNGRVGSLLEVGTGFHPELTGRENIFLNGAILGMTRREVARKFDEIVAFSEIEQFLDTPVKRYSSGMYTRLAFSVAAHLEPEILIVDEVLAVGDAAFQQKCIGKMGEVAKGGRTVLFVSHNMAAVEALCSRAVVLESGRVAADNDPHVAIQRYFERGGGTRTGTYAGTARPGARAFVRSARLSAGETGGDVFPIGSPLTFTVECESAGTVGAVSLGLGIETKRGVRVVTLHTKCAEEELPTSLCGACTFVCRAPRLPLAPGEYLLKIALEGDGETLDFVDRALSFTVQPTDFFGNAGKFVGGVVFAEQEWSVGPAGSA